ncbi:MAG: AAA family ATPase, partial [Microbacterium sp.]
DIFGLLDAEPEADESAAEEETPDNAAGDDEPELIVVPPRIAAPEGRVAPAEPLPSAEALSVEQPAPPIEPVEQPEFSLPQPPPENPYTGPLAVETTEEAETVPRPSFITPAVGQPKPIAGWRGFLARIGLPVGPSRAQLERASWEQDVSLQWAGCRTIAVANGKGGVGKTMTTAMLAAVFARHGGGNVLAWDNNDTRGTLGWRTEQGLYDTTLRDLLPEATRLLEPTSSVSEIARFVHHQATDRYDVLRSNPELLAMDQRITTADFDLLMQVAARYYRLVIFDSGNDESADRWLRMIDSSYQLVVPTLAAPESAESAALLLDALRRRDEHSKRLADEATVIVSQSERSSLAAVSAIAEKFAGHVRAVEIIPFDHGLKSGPLRFDGLQSATRDAWVRAAAAVARGL